MGLTVQKTVKCPKCDYEETYSVRLGMGEETNAGDAERDLVRDGERELSDEHPNHSVDTAGPVAASAKESAARDALKRAKGKH